MHPEVAERPQRWGSWLRWLLVAIGLLPLYEPGLALLGIDSDGLARLLALQCRNEPDRGLSVAGNALPVCARCLGLYLGVALGALVPLRSFDRVRLRPWLVAASLLMLVDVASESMGLRPPIGWLRLLTGLVLTGPVALAAVSEFEQRRSAGSRA